MGLGVQPAGWKCAHGNALQLSELAAQEGPSPQSESFFKDNVQKVKNVHDLETSGKRWSVLIEEGGGHWEEVCES